MRLFYSDLTAAAILAVMLGIDSGLWGLVFGVTQWVMLLFNLWIGTLPEAGKYEE